LRSSPTGALCTKPGGFCIHWHLSADKALLTEETVKESRVERDLQYLRICLSSRDREVGAYRGKILELECEIQILKEEIREIRRRNKKRD